MDQEQITLADVESPGAISTRAGLRATWIGAGANVALMIFKIWAGILANSQALIADGIHSLTDLFSDFVVILGLKWGRQAEDADHPFGHARIETISSMIIGLLLIGVGIGITYNAILTIYHHEPVAVGALAIWAAAASIVIKEALFWYTIRIGRKLRSLALIGNAWHHRSDALSSIPVLIGVVVAYVKPDWHLADSFAALFVTFFVVKVGIRLTWSAFKELADTAPDREVLDQLRQQAAEVGGVLQVHDLRARYSGSQIFVEIHIVVDERLTVREGHEIAAAVKYSLLDEFRDVTRVITHVDPEVKDIL
jgi:cation diffusion facilitator family transporter